MESQILIDPFSDHVPCWMSGRIHKFERAGLGKAPFQFVRLEIRRFKAAPDAPSLPGGTCSYCGEAIVECCVIRDRSKNEFIVGNVCVHKTDDAGLVNLTKKAVNKYRREMTVAREAERIASAKELLAAPDVQAKLQSEPHPHEYRASQGLTRLSWAHSDDGVRWQFWPDGSGPLPQRDHRKEDMTQSTANMTAQQTEDYLKSIQIPQLNIGNWTDEPCFFVSIVDGPKYAFILGPFRTEAECREYAYLEESDGGDRAKHLAMIRKANELDAKAAFYGFGTCKAPNGHRSGVMNKFFGL